MQNAQSSQAGKSPITCFRPRIGTGQHKAVYFHSFGFNLEAWEELASALLNHARQHEVVETVVTPFGRNFVIEGELSTPDGRAPNVRVVWFIANGEDFATLATAYPLNE